MEESNLMTKYYVYALLDPRTNKPRYIGATKDKLRLTSHLSKQSMKHKTLKNKWIRALLKLKKKPVFKILATCKLKNLYTMEKKYITMYRNKGYKLLNVTSGGRGWTKGLANLKNRQFNHGAVVSRREVYIVKKGFKARKRFKSCKDAARFIGVDVREFSDHLKNRRPKSVKGYQAFYKDDSRGPIKYKNNRAILGVNVETGVVTRFARVKDALKLGFNRSCVYASANGVKGRRVHKGYTWDWEEYTPDGT